MKQNKQNLRMLRSTLAVSIPTLVSRLFGYLRDLLQAFYMGTEKHMDEFAIAFLIPNLLRRLTAEGAMTAAFIPVFTQYKQEKKREELWRFANAFFFDLTLVMAVVAVLGILFSPLLVKVIAVGFHSGQSELTVLLTRIIFPYIFFVSLAALIMAILNCFHKFFVPAFTPVLFNLAIISAGLIFAARSREPALVFAVGVVVGGALQLAFQIPFVWRKGMRFQPLLSFSHPAVRKVARLMIPGVFGAGIYQINMAISRAIATGLGKGSVSSLYFSSRIQELTLGLFSIALGIALLPNLSEMAVKRDFAGMHETLAFSLKMIILVTFPAAVGLLMLNRPIIRLLFEYGAFDARSTTMTSSCLIFFAVGLPFVSAVKVLAPAFYSLKDTRTPVIVGAIVTVVYIGMSLILMHPLQVSGIALALSISSLFNMSALFYLLGKKIGRIGKRGLVDAALRTSLASAVMAAVVGIFIQAGGLKGTAVSTRLAGLAGAVALGILAYIAGSLLFNRDDFEVLRNFMRRRSRNKRGDS